LVGVYALEADRNKVIVYGVLDILGNSLIRKTLKKYWKIKIWEL
jgi:hypothetical protein